MIIVMVLMLGISLSLSAGNFDDISFDRNTVVVEKEGNQLITTVLWPSMDIQEQSAASQTALVKRSVLRAKLSLEEQVREYMRRKCIITLVPQELSWWEKLCCCRNRKR